MPRDAVSRTANVGFPCVVAAYYQQKHLYIYFYLVMRRVFAYKVDIRKIAKIKDANVGKNPKIDEKISNKIRKV